MAGEIAAHAAKQTAFNNRQGAAIDSLVTSTGGLVADITRLNDKIVELQNSAGQVTPEDAALINDLEVQGEALVTRGEAVAAALKALDDAEPPVVPPAA